jgi:hypothetical protein
MSWDHNCPLEGKHKKNYEAKFLNPNHPLKKKQIAIKKMSTKFNTRFKWNIMLRNKIEKKIKSRKRLETKNSNKKNKIQIRYKN